MRWLPHASTILLLLYPEKNGLLTPEVVERAKNLSGGISDLTQETLNTTLKKLETGGHVQKERTEEKSDKYHNSPNRIRLTSEGRAVAKKLTEFFTRATTDQQTSTASGQPSHGRAGGGRVQK